VQRDEGDLVRDVVVAGGEDRVAALERNRRERAGEGVGGARGEGYVLGSASEQLGGGAVEVVDLFAARCGRLVASQRCLELEVVSHRIEDSRGEEPRAGVVEVDPFDAAGRLFAEPANVLFGQVPGHWPVACASASGESREESRGAHRGWRAAPHVIVPPERAASALVQTILKTWVSM
jgi:hypothetical protein